MARAGARALVEKPFRATDLAEAVADMLDAAPLKWSAERVSVL
jgi:FixJ family two-component response regulator